MTAHQTQTSGPRLLLVRGFALALIVGGMAALLVSLAFGLNRPHIGISLCSAGLVSLYFASKRSRIRRALQTERESGRPDSQLLRRFAPPAILLAWAPAVWILMGRNDVAFFIVVTGGIFLTYASLPSRPGGRSVLLSLLLILSINLILLWRMLQFSTGPIGVDPWFHASVIRDTVGLGGIPPSAGAYESFPLFHVFGSVAVLVLGLSPFLVLAITSCVLAMTPVFVFLLARSFIGIKTALAASLLFAVADQFLFWQVWTTPMGLGILFFAMFLAVSVFAVRRSAGMRLAAIVLVAALILVHPLVTMFAILALLLVGGSNMALRRLEHGSADVKIGSVVVLLAVMTFAWWMFSVPQGGFDPVARLTFAARRILGTFELGNVQSVTGAGQIQYTAVLARDLGVTFFLFLAPVGAVRLALDLRVPLPVSTRFASLALAFIGIPLVAGAGGAALVLVDRWFVFGFVSATVLAGVAIGLARGRSQAAVAACIALLMLSSPLGSVVASPFPQQTVVREYYAAGEIAAPSFLSHFGAQNTIVADGRYERQVLDLWYDLPNPLMQLTPTTNLSEIPAGTALVVRTASQSEPVVVKLGPTIAYYDYLPASFWVNLTSSPRFSRIFDNGQVWVYKSS